MHQQKLDEDGLASSYLLLTALLPLAGYLIYSITRKTPRFLCNCKFCVKKKPNTKFREYASLSTVVLIISVLIRNIFTIKIKKEKLDFDPYTILNITIESTETEIKKNYKKLLKTFSRKLNIKDAKKTAEENIKKINMAYSMIKDPQALDAFLNNTATSELLIALPSFIVNFSASFLFFYIAVIAVILPLFCYLKYRKMQKLSATGSLFVSNENFLDEFDNFSDVAAVLMQQIFVLVGESGEFVERKWRTEIPENLIDEEHLMTPIVTRSVGYLKLILYLTRKLDNDEDRSFVAETTLKLIEAYKKIAIEKERASVLENLIIFEKLVLQALPSYDFSLAQYPGITIEQAFENCCSLGEGKRSFQMEVDFFKQKLPEEDCARAMRVLESIPNLTMQNLRAFTFETQEANEESGEKVFLTDPTQAVAKDGDFFVIPKESACNVSFDLVTQNTSPICHAPFINTPVPNKWYVFTAVNDRIFGGLVILDQFEGKKRIQMGVPYTNGKFMVRIYVLSNGYFGNNLMGTLSIKFI